MQGCVTKRPGTSRWYVQFTHPDKPGKRIKLVGGSTKTAATKKLTDARKFAETGASLSRIEA